VKKPSTIKVGTRGSALALAQTNQILKRLKEFHPTVNFVVVPIKTAGDRIKSAAELRKAGKGLFVKEIERAQSSAQINVVLNWLEELKRRVPVN
jgi:hydroxymethylbilane synthase